LRGQTAFRSRVGYTRLAAAALAVAFLLVAVKMLPVVWARLAFPYADNLWSEEPLYWQMLRFAHGGPLYDPIYLSDSFNFLPVYLLVLSFVRAIFVLPLNIISFRSLSTFISLLSLVPLAGCTMVLGRRVGIRPGRNFPFIAAIALTAIVSVAVLTRAMTFDSLHPDAALLPIATSALYVYLRLAEGEVPWGRWSWALLVIGLFAAFTKLNAVLLLPVLLAGLYYSGIFDRRQVWTLLIGYAAAVFVIVFVMPGPMRTWSVTGPLQIPYEFSRLGGLLFDLSVPRKDIGLLTLLAVAGSGLVLRRRVAQSDPLGLRREIVRSIIVDGCFIGGIALVGMAGYFKRGGSWAEMQILAYACVPYAAVVVATCLRPRAAMRIPIRFQAGAAAILALAVLSLNEQGQQPPAPNEYALMANAQHIALRPCADARNRILVTAFADLFFTCPNASYALVLSWGAALNDQGYDITDRTVLATDPQTKYVVWLDDPFLVKPPAAWLAQYQLIDQGPVPFGYGQEVYDGAVLQIFQRKEGPKPKA
jgi:hypothetical protein